MYIGSALRSGQGKDERVVWLDKGKIAGETLFKLGNSDFQAELSQARAAKPGALFIFAPGGMGVAFRWSMLPDDQTFEVGDWGQGFTTVKLPPGTRFDLHYGWSQHGEPVQDIIKDMQCAPEDIEK